MSTFSSLEHINLRVRTSVHACTARCRHAESSCMQSWWWYLQFSIASVFLVLFCQHEWNTIFLHYPCMCVCVCKRPYLNHLYPPPLNVCVFAFGARFCYVWARIHVMLTPPQYKVAWKLTYVYTTPRHTHTCLFDWRDTFPYIFIYTIPNLYHTHFF